MEKEYIYYDLQTDRVYRGDYSSVANTNVPTFRYKKKKQIYWQYLSSAHKTDGVFDAFDTTLAATTVSATAAIDNNAVHYYDGVPNVAITAGAAITTIAVKTLGGTPRICGRLKLTNASGQTETINYNGFSLAATIYTFTLADADYVAGAQTPTYSYNTTTSTARVLEIPIVKDAAVDCTNKATGLFVITVDCDTLVYQDEIEGTTEITGTVMELTITDASLDDLYVNTIPVRCLYKLDDDGGVAPAPDKDYLTDAENELKYNQLISGAVNGHVVTTNGAGQCLDSGTALTTLVGAINYQGAWNATTNNPAIVSSTGTKGHYYVVSVGGTTSIDGIAEWAISDWIIFNGTVWQKVDNTDIGDVYGPATNTADNIPQWNGTDSKTLKNGLGVASTNTASAIVQRDGSGNFAAGTITANLTGNASGSSGSCTGNAATATTATNATNVGVTDDTTTNAVMYPAWVTANTGNLPAKVSSSKLSFNPSSGVLTVSGFSGPLTGNVTGDASGSSGSCTGNAATATAAGKSTNIVGGNNTTLLGSLPYQSNTDTTTLLGPNTTVTKKYLSQTGDGTNGAAPAWDEIAAGGDMAKADYDTGTPTQSVAKARGLIETGGPAVLAMDAVADGKYLKRSGTTIVGDTPAGGGDVVAPAAHAASYFPKWNATPDSKTLVEGVAGGNANGNVVLRSGENTVSADTITETTGAHGVAVDGLTIKDAGFVLSSDADGDIYYRASGALARLAKGTAGQIIRMNTGATAPEWTDQSKTVYIDAGAMLSCTTAGAASGTKEYATDKPEVDYFAFDGGATKERVQFKMVLPNNWNAGTITAELYWSSATGSTAGDTCEWGVKAVCIRNDDALAVAFGTAQVISDTLLANSGADMQVTAATPAITIGGTPTAGAMICFEVYRNTDGTDDMTEDAWLFGVKINYGVV